MMSQLSNIDCRKSALPPGIFSSTGKVILTERRGCFVADVDDLDARLAVDAERLICGVVTASGEVGVLAPAFAFAFGAAGALPAALGGIC